MWMHDYVAEKLRELELERAHLLPHLQPPRKKPVFGSVVRSAGRSLRWIGEGLESWATPSPPSEGERRRFEQRHEM